VEHDPLAPGVPAQQRHAGLAQADHERDPQRQAVDRDQRGERGADQQLVGERVGDPPERGDQAARAGDVPVGRVGQRGGAEDGGGGRERARLLPQQQHEHQRHEGDPAQRQHVGQVERHGALSYPRACAGIRHARSSWSRAEAPLRSIRHPVMTAPR